MSIRFPFSTRTNAVRDEYEVSEEELGVGISGRVYKCQHRVTKAKCALKVYVDHFLHSIKVKFFFEFR